MAIRKTVPARQMKTFFTKSFQIETIIARQKSTTRKDAWANNGTIYLYPLWPAANSTLDAACFSLSYQVRSRPENQETAL